MECRTVPEATRSAFGGWLNKNGQKLHKLHKHPSHTVEISLSDFVSKKTYIKQPMQASKRPKHHNKAHRGSNWGSPKIGSAHW